MKIVKKNKVYFLNLENDFEEKIIDNFLNVSLDSKKEKDSLVLSIKKDLDKTIKKKIKALLEDKNLTFKDKVEGTFENFLNKKDLSVLKEMISLNEIEVYKMSSKYKKGVYQIVRKKENSYLKSSKDGTSVFSEKKYIILKNIEDVKNFSEKYKENIKNKEIIGLKSFDGNYYVVDSKLFLKVKEKIVSLNLKQDFTIDFLEKETNFSKELLKVTLEILKEEGFVIEKRKGIYEVL